MGMTYGGDLRKIKFMKYFVLIGGVGGKKISYLL